MLSREAMLIPEKLSQFGSQSATRLREVGIASNRRSECYGEYAVSYTHLTLPTIYSV